MHLAPCGALPRALLHQVWMNRMRSWTSVALLAAIAVGCTSGDGGAEDHEGQDLEPPPVAAVPRVHPLVPAMSAADSAAERLRIERRAEALRAVFDTVPALRAREVAELRLDRNAEQIAIARSLGVRASGAAEIERLRRAGRLVPLGDSTEHWVLREMEHSVPYVTPDARAMLIELGRRFHARLDSLGIPRYRMKVTSALRTDETQAALRRTNPNASRSVSAHEFGTTVDVSHERFAVPAGSADMELESLEEIGKEHSRALQAELGRAIWEMRGRNALKVMMEDRQPVYHMTVSRRYPARSPVG